MLHVALPLLLEEVLGIGTPNSSSQLSSGNGNELGGNLGLGGSFGLALGVPVCLPLGGGVLLFISVLKNVSMGPCAKSSTSPAPPAAAAGKFMVRTRLVARRTSGPRAFTRIFLVTDGISGDASNTCYLAANRAACDNVRRGHQILFLIRSVTHPVKHWRHTRSKAFHTPAPV